MVDKYHKTATTLIKGAKTLDRKYYTDRDIYDLELKNIFWVLNRNLNLHLVF